MNNRTGDLNHIWEHSQELVTELLDHRDDAGYNGEGTKKELAETLEVPQSLVSNVLHGRRKFPRRVILEIAERITENPDALTV